MKINLKLNANTFQQLTCNRFPPVLEVLDDSNISSLSKLSSGCWLSLKSYGVKDTALSADCWWEKEKGNRPKLRRKRFDAEWDNVLRLVFVLLPRKFTTSMYINLSFRYNCNIYTIIIIMPLYKKLTVWIFWKPIILSRFCRTKQRVFNWFGSSHSIIILRVICRIHTHGMVEVGSRTMKLTFT